MNTGNTDVDLLLAIQLQEQFEEELKQQRILHPEESVTNSLSSPTRAKASRNKQHDTSTEPLSVSLVDPVWELIDPVPEVHSLFCTYNDQFFWGKLHAVAVSWSPRMTVCAGVCSYERRGGLCSIRLSVPLLKLRPRSDLVETLLHEMIHAYLFVTANNRDRDGHGPEFHKHMHRINQRAMTKISVYHSFHSEVAVYKQHVWQCSGPCRRMGPYYGLVKRSMNRAPGPNDRWWAQHRATCGGSYSKIREPEGFGVKGAKAKALPGSSGVTSKGKNTNNNTRSVPDIRDFFTGSGISLGKKSTNQSSGGSSSSVNPSIRKPTLGAQAGITGGISSTGAGNSLKASGILAVKGSDGGSNIRGFGSNSNASVTSVGVSNAPRSNIVGFNKGLNKTSSTKNSNSSTTNAKGSYSKSGSLDGKSTGPVTGVPNKGGSYGTSGPTSTGSGMRGGGLAGFGGSGTVLVKPRPAKTKQETKTKDVDIESSSTVNVGVMDGASSARPSFSGGSGFVLAGVLTNRSAGSQSGSGKNLSGGSIGNGRNPELPGTAPQGPNVRPVSRLLAEYEAAAAAAAAKLRTQPTKNKISSTTVMNNQSASINAASGTVRPSDQDDGGASRRKLFKLDNEDSDGSDSSDDVPLNSTYRPFKNTSTSKNKSSIHNGNKRCFNKNDENYNMKGAGNASPESTELVTDRTVIIDSDSEDEGNNDTHRECPLCCHPVPRADFCDHIAECVGDWNLLTFDDIEKDLNKDDRKVQGAVADKSYRIKRRNADKLGSDSEDDDKSMAKESREKNGPNASQSKRRKKDDGGGNNRDFSSDDVKNKKVNSDVIKVEPRETGRSYEDSSVDFFDDLEEDVLDSLEKRARSPSQRSSYKFDDTKYNTSVPKAVDSLRGKQPSLTLAAFKLKMSVVATSQSTSPSTGSSKANATKNRRNRVPPNEDRYIYVSDTDDEFDERYWHMPVSSIVQTHLEDNARVYGNSHRPARTTGPKSVRITPLSKQASTSVVATAVGRQLHASSSGVQAKDPPKYPCPVCQELFTEEYITTTHLNTHFS